MPNPDNINHCVYCGSEIYKKHVNYYPPTCPEKRYKNPYQNIRYGKTGEIIYPNPWKKIIKILVIIIAIALLSYYIINTIQNQNEDALDEIDIDLGHLDSDKDSSVTPVTVENDDTSINLDGYLEYYYDDDNQRDENLNINYYDDYAYKYFYINCNLSKLKSAKLMIYGEFYGEYIPENSIKIDINNDLSITFDPHNSFSENTFSWTTFDIPVQFLKNGKNTFDIKYNKASYSSNYNPWKINNIKIGIDTDNNNYNSSWHSDGGKNPNVNGELMIRLILK